MLMIRLSRVGKNKQPLFRVIINEKTKDPWGDYLENLGTYNPQTKEANLKIDRIKYWISKGAQASDTLWNLFISKGIVEGKKRTVTKITKQHATRMQDKKDKEKAEQEKIAASQAAAKEAAEQAAAKAAAAESAPSAPESAPTAPAKEEAKPEAPAEPKPAESTENPASA